MKKEELCPCGSGKPYGECCGPIIEGAHPAQTASDLMRARYTAYAINAVDFLYESSGPRVRAEFDRESSSSWSKRATWQGIEILSTERGGPQDKDGVVSFIAHYTMDEQACEHREVSTFERIDGQWRFIDGQIDTGMPWHRENPKVGRNDPCPCGSGKKYKKCCGRNVAD